MIKSFNTSCVIFRPAVSECRHLLVTRLHDLDRKASNNYLVLGQIVGVHIEKRFVTSEGLFDTACTRPIGRCGYLGDYAEVTHLFQMRRLSDNDPELLNDLKQLTNEVKEEQ